MASRPPEMTEIFQWGEGGRRLTPDQIAREQEIALMLQQQGADFSPLGHWTQGLARVASGLSGGLRERAAEGAMEANAAESNAVLQALLAGGGGATGAAGAAIANPFIDPQVQKFAQSQVERVQGLEDYEAQRKIARENRAPHFWETNSGSLGMVGADGMPTIVYNDPTPKTEMIQVRDPATGQVNFYRVPQQGGGGPASQPGAGAMPAPPAIGSVLPDPRKGGPMPSASGGFR